MTAPRSTALKRQAVTQRSPLAWQRSGHGRGGRHGERLPVRPLPRRAGPARAAVRRARRRGRARRLGARRIRSGERAARSDAPRHVRATRAWTTCCAGSASGSGSCATGAGWTASWSRPALCWTPRSGRSGPSCSPTPPTRPGCARPSSTRCRGTPRRRSGGSTDYEWRSPAARETFEKLKDLLRREVLDSQFRGMKQSLQQPDPDGHAAGQGHDGRAQRDARGGRPAAPTPSRTSTTSWRSTGTCSPIRRATSTSWSTRWSAGWRRRSGC